MAGARKPPVAASSSTPLPAGVVSLTCSGAGKSLNHWPKCLRIVKAAAKRAGLPPDVSPHWLRRAHASHALDRGTPISLVQATLGHASIATTDKYLQPRPEDSSARYEPE